jgi:biopolymer transport protein ExbB
MRQIFAVMALAVFALALPCFAQDARLERQEALKIEQQLVEAAKREKQQAIEEARRIESQILEDKTRLKEAINNLEKENARLDGSLNALGQQARVLEEKIDGLTGEARMMEAEIRELAGFVKLSAKELDTLLHQSPQSASPGRRAALAQVGRLAEEASFPSMEDLAVMQKLLEEEIAKSGQVRKENLPVVTRQGNEEAVPVMFVGNFSAFAKIGGQTDFLLYSEQTGRFFEPSRPSPKKLRKNLASYIEGQGISVAVDLSRGAALRQMIHRMNWSEQLKSGGPIVYPILAIAILALVIVVERLVFLLRVRTNVEGLMGEVIHLAQKGKWDECVAACKSRGDRPVPRVLAAGLGARSLSRQDMENVLAEAILREIPRLERFLPTLGMLAAIAPLLGLLGTVTGMINTFEVITFAGTGDPRLMSGGISEALVTTMLGLSVAIPVTVAHVLLSRMVERIAIQMEEKSMALVNELAGQREA